MSVAESHLGTQGAPDTSGRRRIGEIVAGLAESTTHGILSLRASLGRIKDAAFSLPSYLPKVPHKGTLTATLLIAGATILVPVGGDMLGIGSAAEARRASADEDAQYYQLYQQVIVDAFGNRFGPTISLGPDNRLGMPDLATFVGATGKDESYGALTITNSLPYNLTGSRTPASAMNVRLYFRSPDATGTVDFQKVVVHGDLTPTLGDPDNVDARIPDLQRILGEPDRYEYGIGQIGKSRDPEPAATAVLKTPGGQSITTVTLTRDGIFNYDSSSRPGLSQ